MSFEDNPVKISFKSGKDLLFLVFSFHESVDLSKNYKVDLVGISSTELELKLFNFNNPLGIGNTSPIFIGTNESKKIYLNYRVYTLQGVKSKLIHYTIYEEE